MKLVHGGDIEGFRQKYGREPIDFSANVSPLGLPMAAREAIVKALNFTDRYPDPLCRELCQRIGEGEGVSENFVLCGNGASDILYRLVLSQKPKTALLTAPTFAGYEEALRVLGCELRYHDLKREDQFDLTEAILEKITPEVDIVFICNPNNPTGRSVQRDLLVEILLKCEQIDSLLVVDECFNTFLQDAEQKTMKPFLNSRHLLILKAYTKQYAMAGVRLGYALCSDNHVLEGIRVCGQTWSVSNLAQKAGIALAGEQDYIRELTEKNMRWKKHLLSVLHRKEIEVIGCDANYVFFYTSMENLFEKLAKQGILIRSCANYRGLQEGYYRVAVRDSADIECLCEAFWNIEKLKEGKQHESKANHGAGHDVQCGKKPAGGGLVSSV